MRKYIPQPLSQVSTLPEYVTFLLLKSRVFENLFLPRPQIDIPAAAFHNEPAERASHVKRNETIPGLQQPSAGVPSGFAPPDRR